MKRAILTAIFLSLFDLVTPAQAHLGPSFDCSKADTPFTKIICASPALSKADLEFAQAYYALRYQEGNQGRAALLRQALAFHRTILKTCAIPASGTVPPATAATTDCIENEYRKQRDVWIDRLETKVAREEATRPIRQHVQLQRDLKTLGYLPSEAKIDGVYGSGTRAAIVAWQKSRDMPALGFLGDQDARMLTAQVQGAATATASNSPSQSGIGRFSCSDVIDASEKALAPIVAAELQYMQQNYLALTMTWGDLSEAPTQHGLQAAEDLGAFVKADCSQPGKRNASLSSVLDSAAKLMESRRLQAWLDQHQATHKVAASISRARLSNAISNGEAAENPSSGSHFEWYILKTSGECVPLQLALGLRDPAALVKLDRENGLGDHIYILQIKKNRPVAVKVGSPRPNGLQAIYTLFRGKNYCEEFRVRQREQLKEFK